MVVKYFRCFSWTNFHHLSCDHYHHRFFSLCSWSTPRFSLTQTAPAYLLIHCIGLGHQWSVACFNIKIGISVMSLPECTASLIKSASNHPSNLSSSFSNVCSLMSHFLKQVLIVFSVSSLQAAATHVIAWRMSIAFSMLVKTSKTYADDTILSSQRS